MINNFKHNENRILKALIFGFFIFISVMMVNPLIPDDSDRSFDTVIVSELIETNAVINDVFLPDFNPEFSTEKDIDRLIKDNNKYFVLSSNSQLIAAFDLLQRKYLNFKPTLLTVSILMLSPVSTYEDYPSVS